MESNTFKKIIYGAQSEILVILPKTTINVLRKGTDGIAGTYRNAEHHAQALIPIVNYLSKELKTELGFKTWRQGFNVHLLETSDGRKFVLRPFKVESSYDGITLFAKVSRSCEIALISAFAGSPETWVHMKNVLQNIPLAFQHFNNSIEE